MKNFKDKIVVITGGATGIGFGFAKALGQEGAKIVISGLREDRLKQSVDELTQMDIEATYKLSDASKQEEVDELATFAWDWKGRVDVLINNAGIIIPHSPITEVLIENVQQIFNVNFYGVLFGSQVFGKRFIEQGTPAAIYNIGSENSLFHGTPLNGIYVATKHAVLAITHSLYEELPEFIDVSLVCPGFVVSELGPKENMKHGMPTDQFIEIAMKQLKNNEFYVVSHAYNIERIKEKYNSLNKAYETYAPRYEGDAQYDVRTLFAPVLKDMFKVNLKEFK